MYAEARVKGNIADSLLREYTKIEEQRENEARIHGLIYYPQTEISMQEYGDFNQSL
jgi:hypothetical protein